MVQINLWPVVYQFLLPVDYAPSLSTCGISALYLSLSMYVGYIDHNLHYLGACSFLCLSHYPSITYAQLGLVTRE